MPACDDNLVFGFPVGTLISAGDYFDYSMPALSALCDGRHYECATVCAVLVDVIMNDIIDNLPKSAENEVLRDRPAGAIINALEERYTSSRERAILARLRTLNGLRIRVVHPGSEEWRLRISPDRCPKEFAEDFFEQLETVVELFGGYTNRQFGDEVKAFNERWRPSSPSNPQAE